jgi:pre-60S factor REI1
MSSNQVFTCVTCNVVFNESEKQRLHYKTDWHRYNLKRKIAELQPVSEQIFGERVQLQKTEVFDSIH